MDGLAVLKTVASAEPRTGTAELAASETVFVSGDVFVGAGDAPGQHAHALGRYVSSRLVERVAPPSELRPEAQLVTLEDTDAQRQVNESGGSDGVGPTAGSAEVQRVEVVALPDAREVQSVAVEARGFSPDVQQIEHTRVELVASKARGARSDDEACVGASDRVEKLMLSACAKLDGQEGGSAPTDRAVAWSSVDGAAAAAASACRRQAAVADAAGELVAALTPRYVCHVSSSIRASIKTMDGSAVLKTVASAASEQGTSSIEATHVCFFFFSNSVRATWHRLRAHVHGRPMQDISNTVLLCHDMPPHHQPSPVAPRTGRRAPHARAQGGGGRGARSDERERLGGDRLGGDREPATAPRAGGRLDGRAPQAPAAPGGG